MKNAPHPIVAELWRRLAAWADDAENDRLADEWIDAEVARNRAGLAGAA